MGYRIVDVRNRPEADALEKRRQRGDSLENYIKVKWIHSFESYPVELYSELDENRYEVRKIEMYRSGHLDFADGSRTSGNTRLGEMPVPPIQEINDDAQFEASLISKETFEALWKSTSLF